MDGGVAEVLQLDCLLAKVRRMSVLSLGEPRCWRNVPCEQYWLFGRLDGVSSDKQGTFSSIGNGRRITRHLENKKALASSERMLMDHARSPVSGGDNCDRESVWKWKAEE